jgi:hypothetical protein
MSLGYSRQYEMFFQENSRHWVGLSGKIAIVPVIVKTGKAGYLRVLG